MKTVYLIGDSIRCNVPGGYGPYVKEYLEGKANVLQPSDNCRFTVFTFRGLQTWFKNLKADDIDIIHWNNGLWDSVEFADGEPLLTKELYQYYLVRIYKEMKRRFPNVRIIFATSTHIVEEKYKYPFLRTNARIDEYNQAAREVLEPLGVEIDDLCAVSTTFTTADYIDGKTHFTEAAGRILAEQVIKSLKLD